MKVKVVFVAMLLIAYSNLCYGKKSCCNSSKPDKNKKTVIAFFDFEDSKPSGFSIDKTFASVTGKRADVLGGKRSLKLDTTKTKGQWQALLNTVTDSVVLEPNGRYEISFDYKTVDVNTADSFFYVSVGDSAQVVDEGSRLVRFRENYKENHQKMKMVLPGDAKDYKFYIGVFGQGKIILDNITIIRLPEINVAADGVVVPSDNYEPYGMCPHFERIPGYGEAEYSDEDIVRSMKMMKEAGIQWIRVHALWSEIEPEEGQINKVQLGRIDFIVDTAIATGIKPYMHFVFQPKWASENPDSTGYGAFASYAPKDMSKWGDYVEMMAKRYKGKVHYWEIYNEIDWIFWRSEITKYAEFLKVAHQRIKKTDPANKIISAGLAGDGTHICWEFWDGADEYALQKLYDVGIKDYFDILAIHPYAHIKENGTIISIDKINTAYEVMKKNGDGDKPIWLTELGGSTHRLKGLEEHAQYFKDVYTQVIKHPKVDKIFWYNWRCKPGESAFEENFGIINADFTPRPAYKMLKSLPKTKVRKVNYELLK